METSVLLLSYNHEKYIEQAIQSLFDQKYQDFEILFLDNASKDGSYEKGVALLEKGPVPFKCIRNMQPASVTVNLNRLLAQAKGNFIVPFSSDDWMTPDYIGLKVAVLKANPALGAVFGSGYWYNNNSGETVEANAYKFKKGKIARSLMLEPDSYFWLGFVYPKSVLDAVGAWDENMLIEDLDLNVRIALIYPIDFIVEPTVYYRQHGSNFVRDSSLMEKGMQLFYEKHKANRELPIKEWFANYYATLAHQQAAISNYTKSFTYTLKSFFLSPGRMTFKRLLSSTGTAIKNSLKH